MAWNTTLASASLSEIDRFRRSRTKAALNVSQIGCCSHGVISWLAPLQPLGRLVIEALDVGQPLDASLRHPLRPPIVHMPAEAKELIAEIMGEYDRLAAHYDHFDEFWEIRQVSNMLAVFSHAAQRDEAVVSMLTLHSAGEKAWGDKIRQPKLRLQQPSAEIGRP